MLHHGIRTGLAATLAIASLSAAAIPDYTLELQARTNFAVNPGGSFNIPANYFFSGEDIAINDARNVSFHVGVTPDDRPRVWFGGGGAGGIVYAAPVGAFMSNVSLNNSDFIVWEEDFVTTPGVYFYDDSDSSSGFLMNRPLGNTDWGSVAVNNAGQLGFRASFGFSGRGFISWDPATPTATTEHVLEVGVDPMSPYSFLFTPSFNNNRQIAGKARRGPGTSGSNPDEIRIWNSNGTSILIVEDDDGDPMSSFIGFDNSVALNDNGFVAFTADLAGGDRGVFVSDGMTMITIATEQTSPEVSDIEFFAPDLSNNGLVCFRAFNASGLRAIFVGDGTELKEIVTEHDIVPTDLGDARIDQETTSSPVFGGAPKINSNGDIAFNAGVTPPDNDQIEWGTGVFVAMAVVPDCPGDANGDLEVDISDLNLVLGNFGNSGSPGIPGDINEDGSVDIGDLNLVIGNFGTSCP